MTRRVSVCSVDENVRVDAVHYRPSMADIKRLGPQPRQVATTAAFRDAEEISPALLVLKELAQSHFNEL